MRRPSRVLIVVFLVLLTALPALNGCQECPPTLIRDPPAFTVTDTYDGAAIPDVGATLTTVDHLWRLDCTFTPFPGTTECSWPKGTAIVAGTYLLQITAPYFESATVEEKVISSSYCGHSISRFEPQTVSLQRL